MTLFCRPHSCRAPLSKPTARTFLPVLSAAEWLLQSDGANATAVTGCVSAGSFTAGCVGRPAHIIISEMSHQQVSGLDCVHSQAESQGRQGAGASLRPMPRLMYVTVDLSGGTVDSCCCGMAEASGGVPTLARLPQLPHFDGGVARAGGKHAVAGRPGACPDDPRMRLHHPAHQLEWLPACRTPVDNSSGN